jgi:hypothetical protein
MPDPEVVEEEAVLVRSDDDGEARSRDSDDPHHQLREPVRVLDVFRHGCAVGCVACDAVPGFAA